MFRVSRRDGLHIRRPARPHKWRARLAQLPSPPAKALGLAAALGVGGLFIGLTGQAFEGLGLKLPAVTALPARVILAVTGGVLLVGSAAWWLLSNHTEAGLRGLPATGLDGIATRPQLSQRFTGRNDLLGRVHEALAPGRLVVLSGLGGIGKTQLALAYSDRYRTEYTQRLWIRASSAGTSPGAWLSWPSNLSCPSGLAPIRRP